MYGEVIAVIEVLLVLAIAVFLFFAGRKYIRLTIDFNEQKLKMEIYLCRQRLLNAAEESLNSDGVLHPMAIALGGDGEVENFNTENRKVTPAEIDEWIERLDPEYSLVVMDDHRQTGLSLIGRRPDVPEPEIMTVNYTNVGGRYAIDRSNECFVL